MAKKIRVRKMKRKTARKPAPMVFPAKEDNESQGRNKRLKGLSESIRFMSPPGHSSGFGNCGFWSAACACLSSVCSASSSFCF